MSQTQLVGARNGTVVCGYHRGRVLYASPHFTTLPDAQLALCDPLSGDLQRLPLVQASDGCFATLANNQEALFFTRLPPQSSHTRRYHGGSAQTLWRVDLNADGAKSGTIIGDVR